MCTDLCPCIDALPPIKLSPDSPLNFLFGEYFHLSGESKYKLKMYEEEIRAAKRTFK